MIVDKLKHHWHLLPINRQLIVLVTTISLGFVIVFLVIDYRRRVNRSLSQKQSVLENEAKTLYEGVRVVEHHGNPAIQEFIDNVGSGMNSVESVRHHIRLDWNGRQFRSHSHSVSADASAAVSHAGLKAATNESSAERSDVVGSFNGQLGSVHVSEHRVSALKAMRYSWLSQAVGVLALGAIAAVVASLSLRQLVAKPIQRFVSTLQCVADGDLSVVAHTRSCRELSYLAEKINGMTRSLAHAQRDHRLHMEKARQIQQNLRPCLDNLVGIEVAELFEPADDVGGDYYDVIQLSDSEVLLCVADVAGHGVPAAMGATLLKALVSEAAKRTVSPSAILTEVNERYCEYVMWGHFATMSLVVIDNSRQRLTYATAGHECPLLQIGKGKPFQLEIGDLPIGVEEGIAYGEEMIEIHGNARLVIVSDGVSESFSPLEEQFGMERIEKIMVDHVGKCPVELVEELKASLESFRADCKPLDDTTLLVARFDGSDRLPEINQTASDPARSVRSIRKAATN